MVPEQTVEVKFGEMGERSQRFKEMAQLSSVKV